MGAAFVRTLPADVTSRMTDAVEEYFVVSVPGNILDDERVIVSRRPLAGDVKLAGPFDMWDRANDAIPEVILAWQVMES